MNSSCSNSLAFLEMPATPTMIRATQYGDRTMVCNIRIPTMARAAANSGLSLAQLERLMKSRRTEMNRLGRKRDKLQKQLDAVDAQIAAVSGGGGGGGGGSRA